jgi:ubiquinone/menaquinone biosynthesis C-methylase UbiE
MSPEISRLIRNTASDGEVRLFSPPMAFEMPEDEYERRIGSHNSTADGKALFDLYRHLGGNPHGVALELGAGGGAATFGFVAAASQMHTIVTDPSPAFLRIIQQKLQRAGIESSNITYGTLLGEDLHRMPSGALDLVFLAASLHHILDYKKFFADAAAVLKPGGMVICAEPFSEGYLMMAMAVELMLRLDTKVFVLKPDDRNKLRRMLEAMYFQSDRQASKGDAEDKHCFLTDELLAACWTHFDDVRFLRNQSLGSIAGLMRIEDITLQTSSCASMVEYLRSFMVNHHLVSDVAASLFDKHVAPMLGRLDRLFMQGDGPALFATVICRKNA